MKKTLPASAMKIMLASVAALIALSLSAGPVSADEHNHRRGFERGRHEGWHGEIHRFHEHDLGRWTAGRWHYGIHAGRPGWWWIVGGIWYYYPAPVYPYPNPYLPPTVPFRPAPPGAQFWYYCNSPAGYYPYVPYCVGSWRPVLASPGPGMLR